MSSAISINGRNEGPTTPESARLLDFREDRRQGVSGGGSIVVSRSVPAKKNSARTYRTTTRRMRGFVIEITGEDAKVGFVVDGSVVEYLLPARNLKKNKITSPGQPFEMDEYEERSKGRFATGTEFRPIVPASAGSKKVVELTKEQEELRNAILAYKGFESQA